MASVWKSASAADADVADAVTSARRSQRRAKRPRRIAARSLVLALLACAGFVTPARAGLENLGGHLSVGYAKLFADSSPAGSVSFAAGLDLPVSESWRAGAGFGFSLLGTRTSMRGSFSANIDYSTFEAMAYGHWLAPGAGPLGRVSLGAGIMTARAEISSAGGGVAFLDLAREELVPAIAIEATLMQRRAAPVRAGLELGTRFGFLEQETWTVASARLAVYY